MCEETGACIHRQGVNLARIFGSGSARPSAWPWCWSLPTWPSTRSWVAVGLAQVATHPEVFSAWTRLLTTEHPNWLAMVGVALLVFPELAPHQYLGNAFGTSR